MFRSAQLAVVMLLAAFFLVGCFKTATPRSDMPVKTSAGTDKKGRPTKVNELTLEDPGAVKKK